MTHDEFLTQYDPSNKEHRISASKLVLEKVAEREVFVRGNAPQTDDGMLLPSGFQEQNGYLCPSAVFGKNGWEWRFSVEYFCA